MFGSEYYVFRGFPKYVTVSVTVSVTVTVTVSVMGFARERGQCDGQWASVTVNVTVSVCKCEGKRDGIRARAWQV